MKKSFRKAIAVLLSVLMIVCAFPLSAFAADDAKPNVKLQFGTFFNANAKTNMQVYTTARATAAQAAYFDLASGLKGADLDYKDGALTLKASATKTQQAVSANALSGVTADYTYKQGDFFTVTVLMENVSKIAATELAIKYSSNIAPAGYGTTAKGATTNAADTPITYTVGEAIASQSGNALYNETAPVGELSYAADGVMNVVFAVQDGDDFVDTTSTVIKDTKGNAINTYTNTAVLATFAFGIVDDGPIQFDIDADGEVDDNYLLGSIKENAQGEIEDVKQTFAKTEDPGSMGITFENKDAEGNSTVANKFLIKFMNGTEEMTGSGEYDENSIVTVPDLPKMDFDETNHYTYAWDETPATTAVKSKTYNVVKTTTAHVWDEGVVTTPATEEAEGEKTYTCTGCPATKTEIIEKLKPSHTHSYTWTYNGDAEFVSSTNRKDGTATGRCSCGDEKTVTVAGTSRLRASTYALALGASITVRFKVNKTNAGNVGALTDTRAVADVEYGDDVVIETTEKLVDGNYIIYDVPLPPQYAKDAIDIVIHTTYKATLEGEPVELDVWGPSYTKSVLEYAIADFNDYATKGSKMTAKQIAEVALCVDLLNYASEVQKLMSYDTDNLANSVITEDLKKLATPDFDAAKLNNVKNYHAVRIENATGRFNSAGLNLDSAVIPRIKFSLREAVPVESITMSVTVDGYTYEYNPIDNPECFEFLRNKTGATYGNETEHYFYFTDSLANKMYDAMNIQIKQGNTVISDTMTYSVETFVQEDYPTATNAWKNVYKAMLKYGTASSNYVNTK